MPDSDSVYTISHGRQQCWHSSMTVMVIFVNFCREFDSFRGKLGSTLNFITVQRVCMASICCGKMSLRLFVRLSVTRRYCV